MKKGIFLFLYTVTIALTYRATIQTKAAIIAPSPTIVPSLTPTQTPTPTLTPTPTRKPIPTVIKTIIKPTIAPDTGSTGLSSIEQEMVTLINQKRGSLPALTVNRQLVEAARRESRDNANRGAVNDCSHTGSDGSNFTTRAHDAGFTGFATGETIGCGHTSAQAIVDGWWNSPGHHDILNNGQITKIGVAWVQGNHTAQTAVVGY